MPTVYFGKKDEPSFDLELSSEMIAIRTRSRRSIRGVGPVSTPLSSELSDATLVVSYPDFGVEVYRVPTGGSNVRSLNERKNALRASTDVQFVGSVLVDPLNQEPVLYTENLFIKFVDDADSDTVLRNASLTVKKKVSYAVNAYFVAAAENTGLKIFDIAVELLKRDDVEYCHPELIRPVARKGIFSQQWHLKKTTIDGMLIDAHANVEMAHATTQGEGTIIAIIDDGVDIDHPEFSGTGKVIAPRDVSLGTNDPRPKDDGPYPDDHGTACAGVACGNGTHGASGVAPKARLIPIRLPSSLGSQQEAEAFEWAADNGADVISCSWGPSDGKWWDLNDPLHTRLVRLPASTKCAIDYAVEKGRGGKGCVVLFAAGNGNESVEYDGYASYSKVIAIAACNDRNTCSVYSDFGKAIWCAFPSSDFAHSPFNHPVPFTPGIWTTDRIGRHGYNDGNLDAGDADGNYTNSFGGTSSSCPGAAGIAALVLSVNPDMKWHEVKELLKRACDKIDPQGGSYDGSGHSLKYGHGRLNAAAAVNLATTTSNWLEPFLSVSMEA
ncbi:S8 family peptidase [Candidatus Electronema sp. PJ]|uniref:S8 family peptidase n=1 Tax=Candidatus Electronema sp. PJ TaxID=3401572 RepID=UPI003AA82EAE